MNGTSPLKIYEEIKFECASLIIGWNEDAGRIGAGTVDYLTKKLNCRVFGEIEPTGFFPLGGVTIEDDVAQFPETKFYYCPDKELLILQSNSPRSDWYRFLNAVLDLASYHCRLTEIYAVGGMMALSAHTASRQTLGVANSPAMKRTLERYGIDLTMDYETPPEQRPTISSFLMWVAKRRNIAGANLWIPIPFYLSGTADPQAWRQSLDFFNRRFTLALDFTDLDQEIAKLNEKLTQARTNTPELNSYLSRLETNQSLTQEENEKLVKDVEEILKRRGWPGQ